MARMDDQRDDDMTEVRGEITPEERLLRAVYAGEAPPVEVGEQVRALYDRYLKT